MIHVDNLHKSFKTKTGVVNAVDGIGFTAPDGQITGLLGPNGAGKTTCLRMLYTLMTPEQGAVNVDGLDARHHAAAVRRSLGVLPDARGVYKRLTEIGRASWRERVCPYVQISVVALSLKKQKNKTH